MATTEGILLMTMYLYTTILIITVVSSFAAQVITANECACDDKCECMDESVVKCQDIGVHIPRCLPDSTKELHVSHSQSFTELTSEDLSELRTLRSLHFYNTNLSVINKSALKGLDSLETFEIRYSPFLQSFESGTFIGLDSLTTITIRDCSRFSVLRSNAFAHLSKLEKLYLSGNAIEIITEDILDGTEHLRILDLSHNKPLAYLPRNVFSKLRSLERLMMSSCSLRVLYPEHVQTAYESGSLTNFDGRYNDWQCGELCELIKWTSSNNFSEIADMGLCSSPEHSQADRVLSQSQFIVCPISEESLNAIITIFAILSVMIIVSIVWCCHKKRYEKLCSELSTVRIEEYFGDCLTHTRQEPNAEPRAGNRVDLSPELQLPREERPTPSAPVMFHNIFGRSRAVTEPRVAREDPPSYEDIVGNSKGL